MSDHLKHLIDWTAVWAGLFAFANGLIQILPMVISGTAGVLSIVWLGWQMYDRWRFGPRR